jgi:H+/Cl- antiporter ClcA
MADHEIERASTNEGLPIAISMGPTLESAGVPPRLAMVDARVVLLSGICILLGGFAIVAAQVLMHLIAFCTNLAFFGRFSFASVSPADNRLGLLVIVVPVAGAIIVGLMARYGAKAIRGHGIPEAMEQVLLNQSRIPARMTFLKPLSAAISIGTGGPFGAEGPIIATGGAMGSLVGQLLTTTAAERKTLLAAGAAAGMAATFGSPVSAVLLAIELLLFEFRPRSIIPVALASVTAAGGRMILEGKAPVFALPELAQPSAAALATYVALGAIVGIASVLVTRAVYAVEDAFERLPIHWMWWPALGAIAVGVVGFVAPRTLGVGYNNITDIVSANLAVSAIVILATLKFISWVISLGSGTSGGTLAPLFTIGGGLGAALGALAAWLFPQAGVDPRVAALVGMAAMFAGASRALLASVVFAFETTLQPLGLLPLLGGCSAAFLVSSLLMRHSIMTERIARRGIRVPGEYAADFLETVLVREVLSRQVVTLRGSDSLASVRQWLESGAPEAAHQGYPVLDDQGNLAGVVTRRDLWNRAVTGDRKLGELVRPPIIIFDDSTLREAADHMIHFNVGRLPVMSRMEPQQLVGLITRADLLSADRRRLAELHRPEPGMLRPLAAVSGTRPVSL